MNDVFWDKIKTVAEGIAVPATSVRKWKFRGYVPSSRHYALIKNAPKFGFKISIEELHSLKKNTSTGSHQ